MQLQEQIRVSPANGALETHSENLQVQFEPKTPANEVISRYVTARRSRCALRQGVASPLTCRHRRPCNCEAPPAKQSAPAAAAPAPEPPSGPDLGAVVDAMLAALVPFPAAASAIGKALEPVFRDPKWRTYR